MLAGTQEGNAEAGSEDQPTSFKGCRQYETTRAWSQFKMIALKANDPRMSSPHAWVFSEFSRRQEALKQELVFALLAVDGRRP